MIDTNAINDAVDAVDYEFVARAFAARRVFVTHVQRNELSNTSCDKRRSDLLSMLEAIGPEQVPTESSIWGVSEWGQAKWGVTDQSKRLFARITELDEQAGKRTSLSNRWRDALIADTAIKNGMRLVTNDRRLSIAAEEIGAQILTFDQFLQLP